VFGNKVFKMLVLIIVGVILTSCEGTLFVSDNNSLDELASVEMLYTEYHPTDDAVLVIMFGDNQTLRLPEGISRWTYSERNRILYRNTNYPYSRIGYITNEKDEYFGINYWDGCGGGSLISDDYLFLYTADKAFLEGEEEPSGTLVLAVHGISTGNETLYEFSFDAKEVIEPERCILGTNAEYEGTIYFSDIVDDTSVLRSLDLKTGEIATLFSDDIIIAPSVSPQGDLIAYTKFDGIYTFNLVSKEKHQLVEIPWKEDGNIRFSVNFSIAYFYLYVPVVSWLPSGNELGYHVATYENDEDGRRVKTNYDIYVYSFLTGESELLIDNALLPYWVLP
jgi:hypothetical protein